ncbi:STIP1 y and U box containing protein 1 [Echinococcus multilocularis]|uniref:E3 ubiquitin-protein ligase CHIP n=1 Tax=Echinococcus multilocularis TaxID=6211 RepID=A0A068Y8H3_ECHMU|nr:STIP1 y and U box containing protein 1 [Echinococcus multilocularis]
MEKSKPLDLSRMSHSALKDCGNRFLAASDNARAIECYTLAIKKNGSISTYYSNRALCYLQMKLYDQALADCRRALELDPSNLKAFFFAGQCHLALGHYDEAVAKLTTAHSLALETRKNFGDDITASIRLAKRKRFEQLDEKRRQEEIEFQVYLRKLILEDGERRLKTLQDISEKEENKGVMTKSKRVEDNMESFFPSESGQDTPDGDRDSANVDVQVSIRRPPLNASQIEAETAARLRDLDVIFAQVDERRMKRELPDYLCGQISFELMRDPVITPSGITYDRHSIEAHLRQVGHFDPITRQPLTQDQLVPNLAMKEVISKFLEENPWADGF